MIEVENSPSNNTKFQIKIKLKSINFEIFRSNLNKTQISKIIIF